MKGLAPLQLLNSTRPEPGRLFELDPKPSELKAIATNPKRSRPVGYAGVSTADQNLALPEVADRSRMRKRSSLSMSPVPQSIGLFEAMKSVHEGDTLVVWKLDRLARSARQLIDTVDALRERGAAFRSLTDALDTTTPRARLVFHIFGGGRGYARRSEPSGRHDRAARVAC
jgi:Resolvase, N terminal domain